MATSTTEAELIALSTMGKEIQWLRQLLDSLKFTQGCTSVYADNISANFLVQHPKVSTRTKHVSVKAAHVRELVENKQISIEYIRSNENLSDLLTKLFAPAKFKQLVDQIMVICP